MARLDNAETRRLSFGANAATYERVRPGYPADAVAFALGCCPPTPDVVDVGAGTGALTRSLLLAGARVSAVEPDDRMRARLVANWPQAQAVAGTAEALPLRAGCADAVVVGQAYHWFDPVATPTEFARVLRPAGSVALIWNRRDERIDWVSALGDIVGGDNHTRGRDSSSPAVDLGEHFGPITRRTFGHDLVLDVDSLLALVTTWSYVATRPDADAVLERVRELTRTHPALAGRTRFTLPYVTVVLRAQRRAS